MSRIKTAVALVALALSQAAGAQITRYTVEEAAKRAAEIALEKQQAELAEAKARTAMANAKNLPGGPLGPNPAFAEAGIVFVAEYGVGNRLYGDFYFNETPVTLSLRDKNEYMGWSLDAITPKTATLVRKDNKGKVTARKNLVLVDRAAPIPQSVVAAPLIPKVNPAPAQAAEAPVAQPAAAPSAPATSSGTVVPTLR